MQLAQFCPLQAAHKSLSAGSFIWDVKLLRSLAYNIQQTRCHIDG